MNDTNSNNTREANKRLVGLRQIVDTFKVIVNGLSRAEKLLRPLLEIQLTKRDIES
jgi:hypothetical protein